MTRSPADRGARYACAVVALAALYAGLHWGSTTAGGADSYGYVSEAQLWRRGRLTIEEPIARQSPWPLAIDTWAPLGYRAAPGRSDAIVPLYSPGLPLLMAAFQTIGGFCAAFVVVPLCGALAIWLTYVLGVRLFAAPAIGLCGALLLATSPIFLYQLMNPMTDVPVTAAWTLALVLAVSEWPLAAGLAVGAAILIRPNLAACAIVLGPWLTVTRGRPLRFAIGVAPAIAAVAAINATVYGAPWISGYGTLADLYAVSYVSTNVSQFLRWLLETQTPVVALALVYFVVPHVCRDASIRHPRLLLGGAIGVVWLSYLFYVPFDAWWYLRFLLPAWPATMLLVAVVLDAIARRMMRPRDASVFVLAATLVLAASGVRVAAKRYAFDIGRAERRYVDVARFVSGHTDPDAVLISLQHSGTLRLYANRLTLRFDQLDAAWLDRAVAFLRERGRHPYVVLEGAEIDLFTRRFGALNELGRLDWRPFATLAGADVSIYDAASRSASEPFAIGDAASRRTGWRCDPPAEP
jgi:hypothetical protein